MVDPTRENKIVYESPSFGGFKLSGAFTPRLDEVGSSFVYSAISATPAGPRVQNSWFIVPSFNRKFGDMSIGLMGSYGQGTAVKEDGSKPETDTLEDPKLWNVSADLQFKGFQIAGAYSNSGTSLLDKTEIDAKKDAGYGWNAVAAYNFDHAKIAVAYMKTSVTVADSDTADVDVFTAYADYKLADGVKILISENYLTGTQSKVAKAAKFEDTASNVVYIGFDVRF
jgi:predicted porin